jgi:hypothetical protein
MTVVPSDDSPLSVLYHAVADYRDAHPETLLGTWRTSCVPTWPFGCWYVLVTVYCAAPTTTRCWSIVASDYDFALMRLRLSLADHARTK